jgi:hypothetical protein
MRVITSMRVIGLLRNTCAGLQITPRQEAQGKGTGQNRVILHVNGPNEIQSLELPWQAILHNY